MDGESSSTEIGPAFKQKPSEKSMMRTAICSLVAAMLPVVAVAGCEFVPSDETASEEAALPVEETGERTDAASSIRDAAAAFSAAFEAGDTTALGELYTENALLLAPGDTIRGRVAIRRYFRPREGGRPFDHQLVADDLEIHGDVAVDRGRWIQTFQLEDGGADSASGVYLVIWRRGADGRWRMSYDMWHDPYE